MAWLTQREFEEARQRISPLVHRTPLLSFATLGRAIGSSVFLKCENLQKTGSFKVRGALNAIAALGPDERARGVVTISAGNHAQAVAWAARRAGIRAVVVMPAGAAETKVAAARGYGADVRMHGTAAAAFVEAERLARDDGLVFLHPFDAEPVIAGHGSTALEVDDDLAGPACIVVPVGGGGQIAGIAGALAAGGRLAGRGASADRSGSEARGAGDAGSAGLRLGRPGHRVFGVEPEGAAAMHRSLKAGRAVRLDSTETIADGLAPPMAGTLNYRYVREFVEDVVVVSDAEILAAMRLLATRAKLVAEPSGAAAVAALMYGRVPARAGETVAAVVSGGNVDPELLARALAEGASWP